ncbi:MAG: DUF4417 domain-containing protein [Planctomycetes bacterium]|nr:DUF4417 domain-containing protein [Planctomycetota bacterium]
MEDALLVPELGAVAGRRVFDSSNRWGIPDLLAQGFGRSVLKLPLYRYRTIHRKGICHFFLHDGRFESVWSRPAMGLKVVRKYEAVLTPDFSLFRDRPPAEQVWNTYRARWVGRWWQEHGLKVIPTVSWAEARTFRFCFEGIPKGQIVAIATFGTSDRAVRRFFVRGLDRMFERLEPTGLIAYGIPPRDFPLKNLIPSTCRCVVHPHQWQQWTMRNTSKRKARKKRK